MKYRIYVHCIFTAADEHPISDSRHMVNSIVSQKLFGWIPTCMFEAMLRSIFTHLMVKHILVLLFALDAKQYFYETPTQAQMY